MAFDPKIADEGGISTIANEDIIDGVLPEGLQSIQALHSPFEWYEKKRSSSPVDFDSQRGVYDVFTYELVKQGLQDSDRFVRPSLAEGQPEGPLSFFNTAMLWSDGDDHRRQKRQLFEYFSPRTLDGVEETTASIAQSQLDRAVRGGSDFDFVDRFAVPVSMRLILDRVGIPESDYDLVRNFLKTFRRTVMPREESAKEGLHQGDMSEAANYFDRLVSKRSREEKDDLISRLVHETDLSPTEIGANCFDFVSAGQGTMSELLTNTIYCLDNNDMIQSIDEYNLNDVLEEVLRYRSPLQSRARLTTESVTLGERQIPDGEKVVFWIGAANRDPAKFDQPNAFVPERRPEHLAFGSGVHKCIAAQLARFQARVILRTLFANVERISIKRRSAIPKPVAPKLGFDRMPVRVDPV